ncbi:MAG: VWA domain-containing protein [Acidobacteriota bacterium]
MVHHRLSSRIAPLCIRIALVALLAAPIAAWAADGADAPSQQAASPTAQPQTFGGSADVVYVEVPVNVVHDGKPVRGLTADNFEIVDGRTARAIDGFEVIDLDTIGVPSTDAVDAPIAPVAVPAAARRHFLLLFDLTYSDPESIVRARGAARELVSNDLHTQDLAAVATYSQLKGPEVLIGFTSDRHQLDAAIESLGMPQLIDRRNDPLGLSITGLAQDRRTGAGPGGRRGDGAAGVREDIEDELTETLRNTITQVQRIDRRERQARVVGMARGMGQLAQMLDAVRGRKHVVYLSQGFDSSVFLGDGPNRERSDALARGVAQATLHAFTSGDNDEEFGSTAVQNALARMAETFQRTDATIQAIDIAGVRNKNAGVVAGGNLQDEGLYYMANETGGQLYRNANDLGEALGELLDNTSVTYLLAFRADNVAFDGSYRKLKIRLRGDAVPRGTRAYHRAGYFTPKPYAERSAGERQLDAATRLFGREGGALDVNVLGVPVAVAGTDRAYVPVVIEIGGASLLDGGAAAGKLPVEVYGYAVADDGTIVDRFAQAFQIDASQSAANLRARGVKVYAHADLPAGDYALRVLVRQGVDGRSTLRVHPLRVPDFARDAARLLPPMVAEPRDQWLLVREPADRQREDAPFPFVFGDNPYMPAAAPSVPARGAAAVAALVYGVGDAIEARGHLLDAAGRPVDGAQLGLLGARAAVDRLPSSSSCPARTLISAPVNSSSKT